tara:strand:+ start:279 stop:626 length:348 start_codon:yes stop_codon:yes gene_type:complete
MAWEVETTDAFDEIWEHFTEEEQIDITAYVGLLEEYGPSLRHPYSSGINGSKHSRMRELRVQHQGRPYRFLYAFDPRRVAILLIGGDKTGNDRWYKDFIPKADKLYDEHLKSLED